MDGLFHLVLPNFTFQCSTLEKKFRPCCVDGSFEDNLVWQFKQTYLAGLLKLFFSLFKTNPRSDFGDEKF